MLDIIIQNLMTTAGNFRTNRSTRDWLSIDEIDSFVYKKVNNIEPRQFDLLLNESLTLLVAESEIIEQHNVNNLRVFASINYRLPFVYRIINSFKRNSMTFCVIMFFTCIIYILTSKHNEEKLIKKKSPHYTSMISEFIRSSKSIAVSETQIKERFSNEIENFQKYWKYIKKELESAQLIRVVNNGTENYYSFIHQ